MARAVGVGVRAGRPAHSACGEELGCIGPLKQRSETIHDPCHDFVRIERRLIVQSFVAFHGNGHPCTERVGGRVFAVLAVLPWHPAGLVY